jgi:hypothetical protein
MEDQGLGHPSNCTDSASLHQTDFNESGRRIDQVLRRWRFLRQHPHSTAFCEEIKPPLQQHKQAISESNQKINMHASPEYPPCETRKLNEA